MKPTVMKKISQTLAMFLLISMLVPALAFASDGFKYVTFDGKAVSGSVYGTTYLQNGVSVFVYGPDGSYVNVATATYSTYDVTNQVYVYNIPTNFPVTNSVYSFITLKAPDVTTVNQAVYDTIPPAWTNGSSLIAPIVAQNSLTLSWSGADSTAVSYNLYNGPTPIASNVPGTSYVVSGLMANTPYTFTVQAVDSVGNVSTNGPTNTFTTAPASNQQIPSAPVWASNSVLTATYVADNSLTLNWSGADSTTVSYNVYKGGSLFASSLTGTTYNVTGLASGTPYTFQIQAVNNVGSTFGPTNTFTTTSSSSNPSSNPSSSPSSSPSSGGSPSTTTSGSTVSADSSGNVDATALSNAFANSAAVTISITGDAAQLPASALLNAASKDGATVTISSSEGTYTLPLSVLKGLGAIAKSLGVNASDLTIKVTISKVSGDTATVLNSAASSSGIKLLADAVDFNVQAVTKDGKSADIDYGNTYVSRTLNLNAAVDPNNATGVLYAPATGTFSFVPSTFSGNTATLKRNGNSIYTVASFNKSFTDIGNHWAKADIQLLANKLVIDGMTDSTFAPDSNITRGQFAALVVRALGLTTPAASNSTFKDVKSSDWYANAVNAAAQAGLVNGYEDGTFRADKQITREELAALVVRALNYAGVKTDITASQQAQLLSKFSDSDKIVWGQKEIASAINAGIINGLTDTTIGSDSNATRAQSATMLKRLLTKAGFIN